MHKIFANYLIIFDKSRSVGEEGNHALIMPASAVQCLEGPKPAAWQRREDGMCTFVRRSAAATDPAVNWETPPSSAMHTFIQALREDIWQKIVQHFQENAEIWVFCGFGTSHMCHGNRAATFPRNYAGIDGVEGARGPAAAAQGEMLTVPAPYISTRHRTAPVTQTPGKQPSKQLSRQESQQEL